MLLAVDESLGRILSALERIGQLDNTVVIVTSDHGFFYGEHGLGEERRLAYEETIRIPLLVRYPPLVKAGSTPAEMALSLDIAPTALHLAGIPLTAGLQGRSLLPVFNGTAREWRQSFLVEYYSDTVFPRIYRMGYEAVRTSRYKYIEYRELEGMNEFYDLETDPYEERNLVAAPEAQTALAETRAEWKKLSGEARATSRARAPF
jgi:N-acetylglucosamine-6-sulfatase